MRTLRTPPIFDDFRPLWQKRAPSLKLRGRSTNTPGYYGRAVSAAPLRPRWLVQVPTFAHFPRNLRNFPKKLRVAPPRPQSLAPRRVASSSLHPVMRVLTGDNTQLTPEIWKLSGPPLSWNSFRVQSWGSGLTDNPLGKTRGGHGFKSRGRGVLHFRQKSRKKVDFSAESAQKPPRADPRTPR